MFFPSGTPKPMVDKINAEIRKALQSKEVSDFMAREGAEPVGSSPEELAAYFKREIDKYANVIRKGNIAIQ
jgi:tripartite-type tricarboxylate transporter receptor subunit TctC